MFASFIFCNASENLNLLSYNARPTITPWTPFENSLANLEMSFNEETPPEAITECGIDFAKLTVCSKLTPFKLPSLVISVYITELTTEELKSLIKSTAIILDCFFQP